MKHSSYEAFIPKPSSVQQYNTEKNFFQDGFTKKGLKRALGENGKRKGGKGVRPTAFPFVSHLTPFFRPFCPMPPVESAGFSAAARLPSLACRRSPAVSSVRLVARSRFFSAFRPLLFSGSADPVHLSPLPFPFRFTPARGFSGFPAQILCTFPLAPRSFLFFTDCFHEGFIKQSQFNIFFNTRFNTRFLFVLGCFRIWREKDGGMVRKTLAPAFLCTP